MTASNTSIYQKASAYDQLILKTLTTDKPLAPRVTHTHTYTRTHARTHRTEITQPPLKRLDPEIIIFVKRLVFMLNSTEHDVYPARKCLNANIY